VSGAQPSARHASALSPIRTSDSAPITALLAIDVFAGIHRSKTTAHGLRKSEVEHEVHGTVFQQRSRRKILCEFAGAGFGRSRVEVGANQISICSKK